MPTITLTAETGRRDRLAARRAVSAPRARSPAVVYGQGTEPVSVAVDWPRAARRADHRRRPQHRSITLDGRGHQRTSAIVKELQRHPVRRDGRATSTSSGSTATRRSPSTCRSRLEGEAERGRSEGRRRRRSRSYTLDGQRQAGQHPRRDRRRHQPSWTSATPIRVGDIALPERRHAPRSTPRTTVVTVAQVSRAPARPRPTSVEAADELAEGDGGGRGRGWRRRPRAAATSRRRRRRRRLVGAPRA